MRGSEAFRFALGGTACVVLGAATAVLAAGELAGGGAGWAVAGCAATALPGLAAGTWLARERGRTGPAFVLALAAGASARLALVVVTAVGAARAGGVAIPAGLLGLASGFLAVTSFEVLWFVRRATSPPAVTEVVG